MSAKGYWVRTMLLTLVVLPAIPQVGMVLFLFVRGNPLHFGLGFSLGSLASLGIAFLYGKKADLPEKFITRYGPFLAPLIYTPLAWIIVVSLVLEGDFTKIEAPLSWLFSPFLAYGGIFMMLSFSGGYGLYPFVIIFTQTAFIAAFAIGAWRGARFATSGNRYAVPAWSFALALTAICGATSYVQYHGVFHGRDPEREVKDESGRQVGRGSQPFGKHDEFVRLRHPPSLLLTRDYPQLDGAIALLPIYGAAARAIYVKESGATHDARQDAVVCTNTPSAYERLISGKADMIFAAAPSEEQKKLAAERGLVLTLTPIAREAFVFLVHERNPVKNLSVGDIRAIYGGKIDDWSALGGPAGKILAFQRNANSGSQTVMEQLVMRGAPMRKPLEAEYHGSMGGIIRAVADYRNYPNALGYSFRYYATAMNAVPDLALLSVDGIAPTPENIRSGVYPFLSDVYIVSARPLSENAKKLRDWFLGDEGQQLIADVGYVPIRQAADESR